MGESLGIYLLLNAWQTEHGSILLRGDSRFEDGHTAQGAHYFLRLTRVLTLDRIDSKARCPLGTRNTAPRPNCPVTPELEKVR